MSFVVDAIKLHPLDDDGNALRLVDLYADDLRFVIGEGWVQWDGTRWHDDIGRARVRACREIASGLRAWRDELSEQLDGRDKLLKAVASHAKRSGSERAIAAMVKLAESDERLQLRAEQLDADPHLLNALNGTVDLSTGELRPHDRDDLITRRTATYYDPKATAPVWDSFLERVLPDESERTYVQKLAGAAAVGHNDDEALHVFHGLGSNGKTKLVRTIAATLGDYAATAGAELLLAGQRHAAGQPELVRLRGARLLIASESDEGRRLNIALVKALTGGDTIACRLLYANEVVEFVPVFSPWLVTNHKPAIPEQSEAIWRRVRLVPFTVTISRTERDLGLQGKLLAELPGVLAWIVEGARRYLTDGLEPPDAVEVATESYRADENTIGRFVDDRCVLGDGLWVAVSDLYAAWRGWCTRNGEEHGTQTSFGRRIGELCDVAGAPRFPADRLGTGVRVRTGLRLRPSDDFDGWAS